MDLNFKNTNTFIPNYQENIIKDLDPPPESNQSIEIDFQVKLQCLSLFKQKLSPFDLLKEHYPDFVPVVDHLFLSKLMKFYKHNPESGDELIRAVVFSNEINADRFVPYMSPLINNAPFSFDIILHLLQTNNKSVEQFINFGGIFHMAINSNVEDFHPIISEMLYIISEKFYNVFKTNSDYVLINSFPLQPVDFGDFEEITFDVFLNNLLSSSVENVKERTLEALSILFKNNPDNFITYNEFFIGKFSDFLLENVSFYPYVLNASLYIENSNLISLLLPVCMTIFADKMDQFYIPAILYLGKFVDGILSNAEYCQALITHLFESIDDATFDSSVEILKFLMGVLPKSPIEYFQPMLSMGLINHLSDILLTFNNSVLNMEYQHTIEFLISHTLFILQRVIDNAFFEEINDSLDALEDSLQPFQDHKFDKVRNEADLSIQLVKQIREKINTNDADF